MRAGFFQNCLVGEVFNKWVGRFSKICKRGPPTIPMPKSDVNYFMLYRLFMKPQGKAFVRDLLYPRNCYMEGIKGALLR